MLTTHIASRPQMHPELGTTIALIGALAAAIGAVTSLLRELRAWRQPPDSK